MRFSAFRRIRFLLSNRFSIQRWLPLILTASSAVEACLADSIEPTGPMRASRFGHTATLLRDGRVLVVGGFNLKPNFEILSGEPVTTAELYDPATRKWSGAASPAVPRYGHTATLLDDGTVLVIGGAPFPTSVQAQSGRCTTP